MTTVWRAGLLIVVLSGCGDLLGIGDFDPPGEREPPADQDIGASSAGGAAAQAEPAPALAWWRALGGAGDDRLAAAATVDGGALVGGVVDGVVDAGSGPVGTDGVRALVVLQLAADGSPGPVLLSQGPGAVDHARVAIAPDGSTVVAASYRSGAITIAGSLLPDPAPGAGLAVAVIDGGRARFAISMQSDALEPRALAVDSTGAIAVAGTKRGSFVAGGTTLVGGADEDAFVVKLTPQGDVSFARDFRASGDGDGQMIACARFDTADTLYLGGAFAGDLALSSPVESRGVRDAFVATVDAGGNASLTAQLGGRGASVAVNALTFADDRLIVAATAEGDFEGAPGHGESDIFVAALAGGEPLWTLRLGGSGPDFAHALEHTAGGLLLGGSFSGDFALAAETPPLTSAGEQDAVIAELSHEGVLRWARRFGRDDDDAVHALAAGAAGEMWIAGSFHHAAELDGQTLHGNGGEDGVVALLLP